MTVSARRTTKKRAQTSNEGGQAEANPGESTPISFEDTIQRLGQIVEALEAGELPLEESLRLFEEGVGLTKRSQRLLETAERRVEQLLSVDDDGIAVTSELDIDEA